MSTQYFFTSYKKTMKKVTQNNECVNIIWKVKLDSLKKQYFFLILLSSNYYSTSYLFARDNGADHTRELGVNSFQQLFQILSANK